MKTRSLASFLTRLIWLCMAPLLLLALWLSWDSLQKQEAKHRREGANLAHNFAASIDQHLRARISALNMLAISPLADDPRRWPELYAEAQGFRESFGLHVIFADHGRRMLFNTRQPYGAKLPHLPDSKGKTAAPLALETGQPQVGDIVIGPMAKIPLVAIAVPVLRPGKPTRLMLSIFETAQLQQRLDGLALPEGWSIALQDGTGADIARRSPAGFDAARDVDDDHRFVVRSELSPWSVRLEIPRDSHRDTYFVSFALLAAGLILATLLGVLGGTLASRRLGRQVQALAAPPGLALPPLRIAEIAAAHAQLMTAEADRRESEERYRRLFDLAPLSLALIADDGRVLMLNARFRTELGYTPEDLPNADAWFERAYPDPALRARAQTTWQRAAAGEDIDPRQYRVACKDGSERDMLISTVPQPEGKLAVFIDITEQKQAEQALAAALTEQNQARLATLNQMEDANTARRQAETSAERIRLLAGVVERIAAVHDFAALMNVVRPAVRRLTGADGATLVLNDNGCCFYADEDAIGPLWKGQRFPLESCISGWVMLHGEAAVIEDIYADERIPHEAYRPTFVKSLVMVPVGRNGPVAAIGAYW
ncbi:MAG: PAS domain S-box protein, partial [Azospira sp.]|nr:PAS domain S-box protein [Azospira sp.]